MAPTLRDGDRLLVDHRGTPRPGRLALVRFGDGVVAVKRLDHQEADGWWVSRDNPAEGRDSWSAGAVRPRDVVATVVGRVWPRPGRFGARPRHT
jgi:phage repressor protein C with HTH and peptisase S24 domain